MQYIMPKKEKNGDKMNFSRKKVIIIHGWGGSFYDALSLLKNRLNISFYWGNGTFFCSKRDGLIVRKILQDTESSNITTSYQKMLISQMISSCENPGLPKDYDSNNFMSIYEKTILRNFDHLAIPFGYESRKNIANLLYNEAVSEINRFEDIFIQLLQEINDNPNCRLEKEIKILLAKYFPNESDEVISFLENIRSMFETGGDLDTVASAVFYTHYILSKSNKKLIYGEDYEYGFVNYHEGLRNLTKHGPCDILIADFPSGAIPDLKGDIEYLYENDIFIERFEDHHPFSIESEVILHELQNRKMIGFYELTGPREDQDELDEDELYCGADMVHKNLIEKTVFNSDGCRILREAAHSEDFASGRNELGRMMTELIMGDTCKIELVQLLLESLEDSSFIENMNLIGWTFQIKEIREYYAQNKDKLSENIFSITIKHEHNNLPKMGGYSYGSGSDMPVFSKTDIKDTTKIIMALAPYTEPGNPRFYVGKASEFYKDLYPDADYLIYCYGASIIVGRRLNQADLSINLGELMPKIGSEGDGGHAGAAVGRPSDNPDYPQKLLGRINTYNFGLFVKYIANRLKKENYNIISIKNISSRGPASPSKSGRNILISAVASLIIGLLLVFFSSKYKPSSIIKSNGNFFPQIPTASEIIDENTSYDTQTETENSK